MRNHTRWLRSSTGLAVALTVLGAAALEAGDPKSVPDLPSVPKTPLVTGPVKVDPLPPKTGGLIDVTKAHVGPGEWSKEVPKAEPLLPPPPPPIQQLPGQLPTQLPSQWPAQLPTQLPTQLPLQSPIQIPSQVPGQVPTQLPTLPGQFPTVPGQVPSLPGFPGLPAQPSPAPLPGTGTATSLPPLDSSSTGYSNANPTLPATADTLPASTAAAPAAAPAVTYPQAALSTFQGFAMGSRSYELASMTLPAVVDGGSRPRLQLIRSTGVLNVGSGSYTLANYRFGGPYAVRSQPSPYAPALTGDAASILPGPSYPEVQVWLMYADAYLATAQPMATGSSAYSTGYRRAGGLYVRIVKRLHPIVYFAGNSIRDPGPGPQLDQLSIMDGQLSLWNQAYRLLATGVLQTSDAPSPLAPSPTLDPSMDGIERR